ncbi:MAG: biotin--[acetyl-CoA-carboxylase] ligase [Prevotellaceae bacterium]|jgi:BirA family biotin operon repressor/biotin-[acetyl-CoA-carboxylase] ligase|nr:biotin--[acetyl-CoA-carboxylase] ligase [Prevotellaceae bacterium]
MNIQLAETDSTNRYLKQLCLDRGEAVEELTTVTATCQTAGRGQRGAGWEAEAGKNLTFSFVLYPHFLEARHQFLLSQIVSLSVKEELDEYVSDVSIKWPNDIYRKEKKICGILIENCLDGKLIAQSIAGIGVNVNQEQFQSDAPNPVSLRQITGQSYDCSLLLAGIMNRVAGYYHLLQSDVSGEQARYIAHRYASALFRRTGYHRYADASGEFLARLLWVEVDGRFVLEDEAGTIRSYLFKEVRYIL